MYFKNYNGVKGSIATISLHAQQDGCVNVSVQTVDTL